MLHTVRTFPLVAVVCVYCSFLTWSSRLVFALQCHSDGSSKPIELTSDLALLAGDVVHFQVSRCHVKLFFSVLSTYAMNPGTV